MKKVFFLSMVFLAFSCSVKKNNKDLSETVNSIEKKSEITEEESNIINDFLEVQLKKERYKFYKNYPVYIIKEKTSIMSSLTIYEYCYMERNLPLKNSSNKDWILNDVQIKNIKDTLIDTLPNNWKVTDFTSINVSLMQYSEISKSIKENNYKKYSETLILNLSTPLLIDEKYGFISFESMIGSFGYSTLERFTALMKKNKDGKWEIDSYYYDPRSN